MKRPSYLENVVSLKLDIEKCIGCGMCAVVCPHRVFQVSDGKAVIADKDACMECGACERNCPVDAISVQAGVGCAAGLIRGMLGYAKSECCCSSEETHKTRE